MLFRSSRTAISGSFFALGSIPRSLQTVSYTHLDVYKRQVVGYRRFPLDLPFSGKGRIVDLYTALEIKRGVEGLIHKLLDIFFVDPGNAQTHLDLRRIQVFGDVYKRQIQF